MRKSIQYIYIDRFGRGYSPRCKKTSNWRAVLKAVRSSTWNMVVKVPLSYLLFCWQHSPIGNGNMYIFLSFFRPVHLKEMVQHPAAGEDISLMIFNLLFPTTHTLSIQSLGIYFLLISPSSSCKFPSTSENKPINCSYWWSHHWKLFSKPSQIISPFDSLMGSYWIMIYLSKEV